MHLQFKMAVRKHSYIHGIIEISRRFAVNRYDWQMAEIAPLGEFGHGHLLVRITRLGLYLVRENMRQMMLTDNDFHIDANIAGTADNFQNASGRSNSPAWIARDLDVNNRTVEFRKSRSAASWAVPNRAQLLS